MSMSDPMVRTIAVEAQYYALLRQLKSKGILSDSDVKAMAIDAQESVTHLSNAAEVIEEIRIMSGVRPITQATKL